MRRKDVGVSGESVSMSVSWNAAFNDDDDDDEVLIMNWNIAVSISAC